jgi:hypothetical protein
MVTVMDTVTPPADEDWCSVAEAARRLGVTPTAIHNRIKRGTLPTRANGNFGKLVKVPRLAPEQTVMVTGDARVTVTDERVTITVMAAHIETLKTALAKAEAAAAKAEAAAERGRLAEIEAAAVPALRDTIALLKAALDSEQARNRELRRSQAAQGDRRWRWWWQKAG